jgi:hypothetical protein
MFHDYIGHIRAIVDNAITDDAAMDGTFGTDDSMRTDHRALNYGSGMDKDGRDDNRLFLFTGFN